MLNSRLLRLNKRRAERSNALILTKLNVCDEVIDAANQCSLVNRIRKPRVDQRSGAKSSVNAYATTGCNSGGAV